MQKKLHGNWKFILSFSIFSYIFFCIIPPYVYAKNSIDSSWYQALIVAISKNKIFGSEFVFNYGPLGYLNTGLIPEGYPRYTNFFFHLFILFNFFFFYFRLREQFESQKWISILILFFFIFPFGFFADTTFFLFYFAIYWQNEYFNKPKLLKLILFTFIVILIIPIKLNLSFIAIIYLFSTLIYLFFHSKFKRIDIVISIVLLIFSLIFIKFKLNFDLIKSFKASFDIINAYQDSISAIMVDENEVLFFMTLSIASAVLFFLISLIKLKILKNNFFLFFWIGIAWFLNYKQAFTAFAKGNLVGFFSFIFALSLLIFIFAEKVKKKYLYIFIFCVFTVTITGNYYIKLSDNDFNNKDTIKSFFQDKQIAGESFIETLIKLPLRKTPLEYFRKIKNYSFDQNFLENDVVFTPSLKKEIGRAEIDIIPWDISYLFKNKMNYENRPVIQSYQANSKFLMQLNGEKYWGNSRPEYVIGSVKPFRNQNKFWTDTECQTSLFYNYFLVKSLIFKNDTLFLFKKNKEIKIKKEKVVKIGLFTLNEDIQLPDSKSLILFKAKIDYNIKGKIMKTIFQPPYLMCEITSVSGIKDIVRIPPSILEGGIIVSYLIENNKNYSLFHKRKISSEYKIKSLKFFSKSDFGFVQNFKGNFYVL